MVKSWTNEEAERVVANRESPSYLIRQTPDTALGYQPDKTTHIAALQVF